MKNKEIERLKKTLGDIKDQESKFARILNKYSPDYKLQSAADYCDSYDSSIMPSQFSTGGSKDAKEPPHQLMREVDENMILCEAKNYSNVDRHYKPAKRMFTSSKGKTNVVSYYEK